MNISGDRIMSRLLVVEDSPTQALAIRILLEDEGFEVAVAADGEEALESIRQSLPDLVCTDLEMPRMDGLQLVEAIRDEFPEIPVILMTAHGSEEIAAVALRQGAASYVPKVHVDRDIVPTIRRILTLRPPPRKHDPALACLMSSESRFVIDNEPNVLASVIAHQDDLLLRLNFCDATERIRIGVALQEALLNAIYHGNLELDSDLRQEDEKVYHDLFRERRTLPPYVDRRVHFDFRVSEAQATYVIRDEGNGFDPSKLPDPTDAAQLGRIGGRGLLIIRAFMDEVEYGERGNSVTLVKRRTRSL